MDPDDFFRFADLLPEPMLLVDSAGSIVAANRRIAGLLGRLPDWPLVGRSLRDLTLEAPDTIASWLRACARSRDLIPGSLSFVDGAGDTVDCRAAGAVFRPASDSAPAAILIRLMAKRQVVDPFIALNLRVEELSAQVARRGRAERALWEQRELLRITLQSIGDAVITTDAAARVSFLNPVAEDLTGWSAASAQGRGLDEVFVIVNEHSRESVENPVDRVLREGVIVGLANHTVLVRRDGAEYAIEDSAAPIRDEAGLMVGAVLVFHDVTARRSIERELEAHTRELLEADRRKDEFLAMLAHELRNPMAPITNAVELLQRRVGDDATARDMLDILRRQAATLRTLVDDLLDVSRITRGLVELKLERVALADVIGGALETVQGMLDRKSHRVHVEPVDPALTLRGDRVRLEQVLVNLLANAAKFTGDHGEISIRVDQSGDSAVVRIRDNGIGIAPALLNDIFTMFRQSESGLDRSEGGLGVGLTISRTLVELHGGRIEAFSDGEGRGTEFVVTLPVQADRTAAPELPREVRRPAIAKRVLVVDDNVDAADTLRLLLESLGHEVQVAYDGPQALTLARRLSPGFIVLDLGLPGMDGFEIVRQLREDARTRHATIAALTGYGQGDTRFRAREAGFDEHFVKPVDLPALVAFLDSPLHGEPLQSGDGPGSEDR